MILPIKLISILLLVIIVPLSSPLSVISSDTTDSSCPTTTVESTHKVGASAISSTPSSRTSNDTADSSHFNTSVVNILDIDLILSKVPKKKDVLTLLMLIKDKWYLIGDSLEVNTGDLYSLKISNNSTDMNLSIVINKWLEKPHGRLC